MIPDFENPNGNLPQGVHFASWDEFRAKFGGNLVRENQLIGLLAALNNLRAAGCTRVLIDGSFVTAKSLPGDYDGLWDTNYVDHTLVDSLLMDVKKPRRAMKAKFKGELFPVDLGTPEGQQWLNFFEVDRDGITKGLVEIDLGTLP